MMLTLCKSTCTTYFRSWSYFCTTPKLFCNGRTQCIISVVNEDQCVSDLFDERTTISSSEYSKLVLLCVVHVYDMFYRVSCSHVLSTYILLEIQISFDMTTQSVQFAKAWVNKYNPEEDFINLHIKKWIPKVFYSLQ